MQKVNNYFNRIDESTTELVIVSKKTGETKFLVDTKFVPYLVGHSWCYEKSKHAVYTMDFTREISGGIFEYTNERIYLWKYVAYLHTKCTKIQWNRGKKFNDYRTSTGIFNLTFCA